MGEKDIAFGKAESISSIVTYLIQKSICELRFEGIGGSYIK